MKFNYTIKRVHTAEEYINALKEGCVNVEFGSANNLPSEHVYKQTSQLCEWLVSRQQESPMIAWRYAKALLQDIDEYLPFEEDLGKGYNILMQLAQEGFAPAMYQLSRYYTNHAFVDDEQQAKFWMDKAIQQNYGSALFSMACELSFLSKCHQQGVEMFLRAADVGYPGAIYYVAEYYVDINPTLALQYYERGIAQQDFSCAYKMANCYRDGKLVSQDYSKAEDLYKKCISWYVYSFEWNESDTSIVSAAYYALGNLHEQALVPNASIEQAFCYYESSTDHGFADGALKVAQMCEHGIGTNVNYPKSAEFYRLSVGRTARAQSAVPAVKEALVRICQQLEKDQSDFLAQALVYLGEVYQMYDRDYANAEQCYQKALSLGFVDAGYSLKYLDELQGKPPRYIPQIDDNITQSDLPF